MTRHTIPTVLARADTPLGEWVLRLREGAEPSFEIIANGAFLMDSSDPSTECALADLTLAGTDAATVLVGGLGLGFTLRAVLSHSRVNRVIVAEIAEPLIEWSHGPLAPLLAEPLADPRVELRVADVLEVARRLEARCDVILLDVDNGPDFLVHVDNANIYEEGGLQTLRSALRPGGRLGIWSSTPAPALALRMRSLFTEIDVKMLDVTRAGRTLAYYLLLAAA